MIKINSAVVVKSTQLFLLLVVLNLILLSSSLNAQDSDGDGISDSLETVIAELFLPPLNAHVDDECLPLGGLFFRKPIGFDVVDVGFDNLFAIEYTLYYDEDCGCWGLGGHPIDIEGFTVLVQKESSEYNLKSLQTCGHYRANRIVGEEIWDRLFSHELFKFSISGVLISNNKHANYVHESICDDQLMWNCEECRLPPHSLQVNDRFVLVPHNSPEYSIENTHKQFPPFVSPVIPLSTGVPYVDIYENFNFQAHPDRLNEVTRNDFGDELVEMGLPMRLICFQDTSWWKELYDFGYQKDTLWPKDWVGLNRSIFEYIYYTTHDRASFSDAINSLALHGLPGTILTLLDIEGGGLEPFYVQKDSVIIIGDGQRTKYVYDLGNGGDWDVITWGFGPTADAGNDTVLNCGDLVNLDASGSFQYALDPTTIKRAFGLDNFDFTADWDYLWHLEVVDGNNVDYLYVGSGCVTKGARIPIGTHRIRLSVSGETYPDPSDTSFHGLSTVYDWKTVTVNDNPGPIHVYFPNGGDIINFNCFVAISWTPYCYGSSDSVTIELSTDAGISWLVIRSNEKDDGTFSPWEVPDVYSDQCLVRITRNSNGSTDVSDSVFTIHESSKSNINPIDHIVGIPEIPVFDVSFDLPMEDSTINDSTFSISGNWSGYLNSSIVYDTVANKVTISSLENYIPGEKLSFMVSPYVRWKGEPNGPLCAFKVSNAYTQTRANEASFVYDGLIRYGGSFINVHEISEVIGDFDDDGDLDIGIVDYLNFKLLLNDGNGNFFTAGSYSHGLAEENIPVVASLDSDCDGDLDVVMMSPNENQNFIHPEFAKLINEGFGNFSREFDTAFTKRFWYKPLDLVVNQYAGFDDALNHMDIALVVDYTDSIYCVFNGGVNNFTFAYPVGSLSPPNSGGKKQLISADFDGNITSDFAAIKSNVKEIKLFLQSGIWDWEERSLPLDDIANDIGCADFDQDGKVDLVIVTSYGEIIVFRNLGEAVFAEPQVYYDTLYIEVSLGLDRLAIGDINGNGFPDIVVSGGGWEERLSILENQRDGTFQIRETLSPYSLIDLADFTGDSALDILVSHNGRLALLKQDILTGINEDQNLPITSQLFQNYPNPFNPTTTIEFSLSKKSHVEIVVYNLLGQEVVKIVDIDYSAGVHSVTWDGLSSNGQQVSSGIYLYRIKMDDFVSSKKMLFLK